MKKKILTLFIAILISIPIPSMAITQPLINICKNLTNQKLLIELPLHNVSSQKLWMDYRAITDTASAQYTLLQNAYVGNDGIMRIGDYICVALGQKYGKVGDKFIIEIGKKKVKCIFTDAKGNSETLNGEGWLDMYGNLLEILVDSNTISYDCKVMGDMNHAPALNGLVTRIWKE